MVIIALLIILTLTYFLSTKPAITGTKILNKNLSNAPIIKVFLDLGLKNIHRHLTDDDIRTRLEESLNIQVHKTWFPENDQIEEGLLSAIKNGAAVDLLLCKPDSYILRKRCEAAQEPMGPYWIYRAIKKIHKTITNPENRNINRKITITLYDEWPGCPVIWYGKETIYDNIVMGFYFWGASSPRWPWINVTHKSRLGKILQKQFESISKIKNNIVLQEPQDMERWLKENEEYEKYEKYDWNQHDK